MKSCEIKNILSEPFPTGKNPQICKPIHCMVEYQYSELCHRKRNILNILLSNADLGS